MRSPGITGSSNLAKILLSTLPVPGHVKPAISAAGKLQHAGHEVVFALPETLGLSVPADIRFVATGSANFDYEPISVNWQLKSLCNFLAEIERNLRLVLTDWTLLQLPELRRIAAEERPDILISDCLHVAPLIVALERGVPSATLGVTPYRNLLPGSAPVRSGWGPATSSLGCYAWDMINRLIEMRFRRIKSEIARELMQAAPMLRRTISSENLSVFGICEELSNAYLLCSVPSLEDRPEKLMELGIKFIGPLNDVMLSPSERVSPLLVAEMHPPLPKPQIALVTWGTMQGDDPPPKFIELTRKLLARSMLTVVLAPPLKHREFVESMYHVEIASGHLALTDNFDDFLPKLRQADVFVSNGGFGAVKAALSLGVPIVCCGDQDDKPDVCGRVQRAGVGIGLPWYAGPEKMARAVDEILSNGKFLKRSMQVGIELFQYESSDCLEKEIAKLVSAKSGESDASPSPKK